MRPTRAALLVVATALTPALLLSAPAFATAPPAPATTVAVTSDTPVDEMSEAELRAAIADIVADEDSGEAVVREADKALNGTVDDMRTFLKTGYRLAQAEDDRVAVAHILFVATGAGDKRVVREANEVLDDGSPEALRAWLETGYRLAQAEDDRVAVAHILFVATGAGDKRVVREANEVLDDGSPEALRAWLETGYRLAQAEDDRVAVAHILFVATGAGDKRVVREANEVLDDGSPEALRAFRETGYPLAQAEDDRFYIVRMLADPNISDALRAAANDALDDGSPQTLRYFRTVGQYEVDG